MSDRQRVSILVIVSLSFTGPILFAMVMLEFMGLGEYTRPILTPILVAMFAVSALLAAAISCSQRKLSSSVPPQVVYTSGTESGGREGTEYPGSLSKSARFTIPVQCPHCGKSIELDRVHWDGPMVLVCSECLGDVRVKISE